MDDPKQLSGDSQDEAEVAAESLWMRLLFLILIGAMISLAQTVLYALTIIQFIILLTNQRRPNVQIAWFGQSLGGWLAKAARYQTAAGDEKPWPWTPLE